MVGNDVGLLRDQLHDQVAQDEKPEAVADGKGVVGGVAVQINGAMGPQDDHAVNEPKDEERPGEIAEKGEEEKGGEAQNDRPAEKGKPVLAGFEDVQPCKKLSENFAGSRDV